MTEKRCPKFEQRIESLDQRARADQWQQSATEKLGFIVRVGYLLGRNLNTWNPWRLRRVLHQAEGELARLWAGGFAPAPWRPGGIPFPEQDTLGKAADCKRLQEINNEAADRSEAQHLSFRPEAGGRGL